MTIWPQRFTLRLLLLALFFIGGLFLASFAVVRGDPETPADTLAAEAGKKFKDDELLVKFAPELSPEAIKALADKYNLKSKRYTGEIGVHLFKTKKGEASLTAPLLAAEPGVEWAELNYIVEGTLDPTDPDYSNPALVYGPQLINAPAAWDIITGTAGIVVAIVDSGISPDHPEFAGRILSGHNFVAEPENDVTADDNGHGTHVAGIAAAAMNNGAGSTGIAPGASLLPVKVLNAANNGTWADIAAGIVYAADQGAQIINLSLGGPVYSQTLYDAIRYAHDRGALVVAAAGNAYNSNPFYPASFEEVMAVTAIDSESALWAYSNFGPSVDVTAPGVDIWSSYWKVTDPFTYTKLSGTSMAAPHASGLGALLLSNRPDLKLADLRALIQGTAVDLGNPGWDPYYGYGRIDAGAALAASQGWVPFTPTPIPTDTPPTPDTPPPPPNPPPTPPAPTTGPPVPTRQPGEVGGPG